jgi:hypothetical protein
MRAGAAPRGISDQAVDHGWVPPPVVRTRRCLRPTRGHLALGVGSLWKLHLQHHDSSAAPSESRPRAAAVERARAGAGRRPGACGVPAASSGLGARVPRYPCYGLPVGMSASHRLRATVYRRDAPLVGVAVSADRSAHRRPRPSRRTREAASGGAVRRAMRKLFRRSLASSPLGRRRGAPRACGRRTRGGRAAEQRLESHRAADRRGVRQLGLPPASARTSGSPFRRTAVARRRRLQDLEQRRAVGPVGMSQR